jgi:hypothetical protein
MLPEDPMLPVVAVAASPGCGTPSSLPLRARGMRLAPATSSVEGETEAGGVAGAAAPDELVVPAGPAAPVEAPPEEAPPAPPPEEPPAPDCASAAVARERDKVTASGMRWRRMACPPSS